MAPDRIELDQEPIWTIQFDETIIQYRAFCLYRDMLGARSLSRVAEALAREKASDRPRPSRGKASKASSAKPKHTPGGLQDWSARNRWVERADAYELHLEEERRRERETDWSRIEARQRTNANIALGGIARRLVGYNDPKDPSKSVEPIDWSALTPGELAQFAKVFGDELRLIFKRPTSLTRSVLFIAPRDYESAVNGLIEILMPYIPLERRPVAAEEANAYLQEGGS